MITKFNVSYMVLFCSLFGHPVMVGHGEQTDNPMCSSTRVGSLAMDMTKNMTRTQKNHMGSKTRQGKHKKGNDKLNTRED